MKQRFKIKKNNLLSLFLFVCFFGIFNSNAQITIGSVNEGSSIYSIMGMNAYSFVTCAGIPADGLPHAIPAGMLTLNINGTAIPITTVTPNTGSDYVLFCVLPSGTYFTATSTVSVMFVGCSYTVTSPAVVAKPVYFSLSPSSYSCTLNSTLTPTFKEWIGIGTNDVTGGAAPPPGTDEYTLLIDGMPASMTTFSNSVGTHTIDATGLVRFTPGTYTGGGYTYQYTGLDLIAPKTMTTSVKVIVHRNIYMSISLGYVTMFRRGTHGTVAGGDYPNRYGFRDEINGINESEITGIPYPNNAVGDYFEIKSYYDRYEFIANGLLIKTIAKTLSLTTLPAGISGSISTPTCHVNDNPVWTLPTSNGTYSIVATMGGLSYLNTFTVSAFPNIVGANTATICSGNTFNYSILTPSVPSSYSWLAVNNANITGESITGQTTPTINNTLINTSTTSQNVVYTITPTSSFGCVGPQKTVTVTVNPVPTINAITSPTICSGSTLNIPISSSVTATYSWLANNNPSTTGESTSAVTSSTINNTIVNTTGATQVLNYTITPRAIIGSCFGAARVVTVTVNPKPVVTSSSSSVICSGNNFNLNLSSTSPSTYTWVAVDNSNITGETLLPQTTSAISNTLTNSSLVSQIVNYNVTPTSTIGLCVGNTQTISVTVNPTPQITTNTIQTICSGTPLNIAITSTPTSTTYNWGVISQTGVSGGTTGNVSSSVNNVLVGSGAATYSMIVTTAALCSSAPITVSVNVTAGITITSSNTKTICTGSSVNQIVTPASGGISYSWLANNNSLINGESLTPVSTNSITDVLNIISGGETTVIYTVTAVLAGCPDATQTITVTVNPTPSISFSANNDSLCVGACVSFVNESLVAGSSTISTYTWNFGDGGSSSLINPIYCFPSVGSYTVSLTATTNNGCTATYTNTANAIVVGDYPIADFNYSPESPITVETLVNFDNTSSNASSYNWLFGDGNTSVIENPTNTYETVANYVITLIASNAFGCKDTIRKNIEINNQLFIPTGFTPDGDPKNETFVILGLESYPNNELKVFNRWGNLVYSKKQYDNSWGGFPNVSSASFGSGKLPAATYFYILELNKNDEKPKTGYVVMQY